MYNEQLKEMPLHVSSFLSCPFLMCWTWTWEFWTWGTWGDGQLQYVWALTKLDLITLLCCSGHHWSWNEGSCLALWKGPYLEH